MSDKPIAPGDLVVVGRACDSIGTGVGSIFTVKEIVQRVCGRCNLCGGNHTGFFALSTETFGRTFNRAPLSWLKRIDPDCLNDDIPNREELHA